ARLRRWPGIGRAVAAAGESVRRAPSLRPSSRRDGPDASGLRLLAVAGHHQKAFGQRQVAAQEPHARPDPQPRGHWNVYHGFDLGGGLAYLMAPLIIHAHYEIDYRHSYAEDSPFFVGLSKGKLFGSRCTACG